MCSIVMYEFTLELLSGNKSSMFRFVCPWNLFGWPCENMAPIQCLFRLVNHFVTFGEFKHELQSKNASFGSNSSVVVPCDIEIWQMISTNNRTSLPCQSKLCASFYRHLRIQTRVTVQKWTNLANFVLTSVTLTLDLDILHRHHF